MPKVQEYMHKVTTSVAMVAPQSSIETVIERLSQDSSTRAVFVTDKNFHLLGVISVREIFAVIGTKYMQDRGPSIARELMATKARDIMGPPFFVQPQDDLQKALKYAVQDEHYDIPVVENNVLVGNLNCLEIIDGLQQ